MVAGSRFISTDITSIFKAQTDWIVNNREALNIQVVVHEGDIVNTPDSQAEWDNASAVLDTLIDAEIPFTIAPGDRDHVGFVTVGPTDLCSSELPAALFEGGIRRASMCTRCWRTIRGGGTGRSRAAPSSWPATCGRSRRHRKISEPLSPMEAVNRYP